MSETRILLVAYQCGPGMGSVSQIGWAWYEHLSARQPVTLVTHVRNKPVVDAALRKGAPHDVIYVDTEWFAGPLYRLARRCFPRSEHAVFLVSSLDYFVFDWCAFRLLRTEHQTRLSTGHTWSLVHRVTPVTTAAPSWLGRLPFPMVIGPLNSGLGTPSGFPNELGIESQGWMTSLRALPRLMDAVMGSSRRATRILTASQTTLLTVPGWLRSRCISMLENGVDLNKFQARPWPAAPGNGKPLRILFTGRLVSVKGLNLLLHAMARLSRAGLAVELDVVGDGPMKASWQSLTRDLGLQSTVHFQGARTQADVADFIQQCHVLCLPSVRESGGGVLLEAMAGARPVIALAFGGPGEIVDHQVGALLPLVHPEQVIDDLAAVLSDIFNHPQAWARRGECGRRRVVERHSWPAKIEAARQVYREVLAQGEHPC